MEKVLEHGVNWCEKCKIEVNFKSKAVAVAHYRSKKHTLLKGKVSPEEQSILDMTKEEALAITRPIQHPPEYVPMQLFAFDNNGKPHLIYSDIKNANVK